MIVGHFIVGGALLAVWLVPFAILLVLAGWEGD